MLYSYTLRIDWTVTVPSIRVIMAFDGHRYGVCWVHNVDGSMEVYSYVHMF